MDDIQTKNTDINTNPTADDSQNLLTEHDDCTVPETTEEEVMAEETEDMVVEDVSQEDTEEDTEEDIKEEVEDKPVSEGEPPTNNDNTSADNSVDQNKMRVITKALKNIERDIANVVRLLESSSSSGEAMSMSTMPAMDNAASQSHAIGGDMEPQQTDSDGRVVEGVFDGQNMVGSDGKIYTVPANYASKSKLVEGDMLKLTITPRGSFIYKQIGPIERVRVMAVLGFDPTTGEYYAADETRRWSILKASVTYYRGDIGDEVVLLVPKSAPSKWAAVENIIKNNPLDGNTATVSPVSDASSSSSPPTPVVELDDSEPVISNQPFGGEMPEDKTVEEDPLVEESSLV